jgi:hypothetical protein
MALRQRFGLVIYDECFPASTLVGATPIQEIQPGDLVPSYSSSGQVLTKKVVRVFKKPTLSLVKVRAGGKEVVCTPNHPFLTKAGWVKAGNLTSNSVVRIIREDLVWVGVDNVEVLEPGSDGTFGGLCPDGLVHNLEVEDTGTYLANGFVVHNCHHMSAPVFVLGADLFFGRRLSLTATASRTDGLEVIYQYHLGKVIHSNLTQELVPNTVFHLLKWAMPPEHRKLVVDRQDDISIPRVRTYLGRLEWRNNLIYEHLTRDLQEGRQILVLSHSVSQVEMLHNYLSGAGAGMIIGDTPQENRMPALRNCNPVFGTFQLAREGLNKPSLDTLYVVTPFNNANDLQQAWGRIQRRLEGKKDPLVRVFEDGAFTCCMKSCSGLRGVLRKLNYPYERVTWEKT